MRKLLYMLSVGWIVFGNFSAWLCWGHWVFQCSGGITTHKLNFGLWLKGIEKLTVEVSIGGLTILLLCLAIVGLLFSEQDKLKRPRVWLNVSMALLFLAVLYLVWRIVLTFSGWFCQGDAIYSCLNSIVIQDLDLGYWLGGLRNPTFQLGADGLFLLVLGIAIGGLFFYRRVTIHRPQLWLMLCGILLLLVGLYLLVDMLLTIRPTSMTGGTFLADGLVIVLQGALVIFALGALDAYRLRRGIADST
jgi:hypothetical protein